MCFVFKSHLPQVFWYVTMGSELQLWQQNTEWGKYYIINDSTTRATERQKTKGSEIYWLNSTCIAPLGTDSNKTATKIHSTKWDIWTLNIWWY